MHHRDPYSPEITREIQIGYYGRPLDANQPGDPKDEERFAYPVYVVFLLAPTVTVPFPILQTAFKFALAVLVALSVLLWLRALCWRPSRTVLGILLVLTVGSFAAVQGIKLQQLSLLVAASTRGRRCIVGQRSTVFGWSFPGSGHHQAAAGRASGHVACVMDVQQLARTAKSVLGISPQRFAAGRRR